MHRFLAVLALIACAAAQAQAQGNGTDLMRTPACIEARQQLDQVLAKGGPRDRLDQVRQQAAVKCLGVKAPPQPEGRFVPPPVSVAPIRLRSEPSLPMAPQPPPAPLPPVAIPRPPVLTTCDASGCWDASGGRYNQQGPVLLGPRGICTQQAGSLNCP